MYAWHTTMHVADDGSGIGAGYGGGINWNGHRDWVREDYGPSGRCISTAFPFQAGIHVGSALKVVDSCLTRIAVLIVCQSTFRPEWLDTP